jgi:hypothetical protein
MKIPSQYRRPLLKLIVRARRRGRSVDFFTPNFSSLAVLAALAGAVWMAFSFARVNLTTPMAAAQTAEAFAGESGHSAIPSQSSVRGTVLSKREGIVYLAVGDGAFYHCSGHLSHEAQRQAMTIDVARSRGFAPCPVCFKPKADNTKSGK